MAVTTSWMDRFGDEHAGFSIDYVSMAHTVSVTGWGFWSVEVALAFGTAVVDACGHHPKGARLTLDMSQLKPMREEGQRSFGSVMRSVASLGLGGVSIVTTSQLTKLQLVRLASEHGAGSSVQWVTSVNELGRGG